MRYCKTFIVLWLCQGETLARGKYDIQHLCSICILVPTDLFISLKRRSLGTRNVFRAKAPRGKRNEKGSGDDNDHNIFTLAPDPFRSAAFRQQILVDKPDIEFPRWSGFTPNQCQNNKIKMDDRTIPLQ